MDEEEFRSQVVIMLGDIAQALEALAGVALYFLPDNDEDDDGDGGSKRITVDQWEG